MRESMHNDLSKYRNLKTIREIISQVRKAKQEQV